jgi:hypothetical protein
MSKAFVPRKMFVEHWHQVMGGDRKKNPKLMQLGIFVRGKTTVKRQTSEGLTVSDIDFEKFGSFNLLVIRFPRTLMPYDFLTELKDIWADGNIRPDAFIFLRRDKDGSISGMEGSCLNDDADVAAINAVIAAITSRSVGNPEFASSKVEAAVRAAAEGDFGLSANDIQKIAHKLQPEHSAIIILFENVWERKLNDIAKKHNGAVVSQRLIAPAALAKVAHELASKSP